MRTGSPRHNHDVQEIPSPRLALAVLLLSALGAVALDVITILHWVLQINRNALSPFLGITILIPLVAGAIATVWSTHLALLAVGGGKGDPAFAVTRAMRMALYTAAISTLASLSMWPTSGRGQLVWICCTLTIAVLPLLALLHFGKSKQVRSQFGREFGNRMGEAALRMVSGDAAVVVLLMLLSLISVLSIFSAPTIKAFGWHFIVGREWRANVLEEPVRDTQGKLTYDEDGNQVMREIPPVFGALPVIWGTIVSSIIALLFAVPLSFGAAIFLVRIASRWLVIPVSFLIEFLAAIPSIAYGIWGLFVMCPFLQRIEPTLNRLFTATPGLHWLASPTGGVTGRDMLAGGLILGVMVVPIITAISRDVLRSVPRAQLEGTVALGATWWESSKEMLKFSRTGLFGAVMLGLARAAGETMAITMVIGNNNQIKTSLFAPAQTMSSLLANEFAEAGEELQRSALTEVALILLVMSLVFNIVARYLVVGKNARTAAAA